MGIQTGSSHGLKSRTSWSCSRDQLSVRTCSPSIAFELRLVRPVLHPSGARTLTEACCVLQALAAANNYIVTNLSNHGAAPAHAVTRRPSPQLVASPFAQAAAALQCSGAAVRAAEAPAQRGSGDGVVCDLQSARSATDAAGLVTGAPSEYTAAQQHAQAAAAAGAAGAAPSQSAALAASNGQASAALPVGKGEVLPPWTPDRSPAVDSDGDERMARAEDAPKPQPQPAPVGATRLAAPADSSDALVQQLVSLSRPVQ